MKIYIDTECKCHTTNPNGTFREFDVPFFNGKCQTFIEGYRYCPEGENYAWENGEVFYGECIVPWKPYSALDSAQREYERAKLTQYEQELPQAYINGVNSI
jgi:hypothetical protein